MKNAGGKLVWMAAGAMAPGGTPSAKPSISGAKGGDDVGGENGPNSEEGKRPGFSGTPDPARQAAMKKYSDCLVAHGGTAFTFGGRRGFGPGGVRPTGAPTGAPTTPRTMPTLSAKQQKAMTACKALAPAFGGGRGFGGGPRPSGMPTPAATTPKQ